MGYPERVFLSLTHLIGCFACYAFFILIYGKNYVSFFVLNNYTKIVLLGIVYGITISFIQFPYNTIFNKTVVAQATCPA